MKKKILTIVGARPQIIKAAAVSRAIRGRFSQVLEEVIVHTGQHYDEAMSQVFFDELDIPQPHFNLKVGSGSHGAQTAAMLSGIENLILSEKPASVLVYGDTNSTIAGALAASKLHVPVIHVEAGLRSFNKSMPEEINRIACDHMATLLFTPTQTGLNNLLNEGFRRNTEPFSIDNPGIFLCGDVMYDNSMYYREVARSRSQILNKLNLDSDAGFVLATIHRDHNTDIPERLQAIILSLINISDHHGLKIVLPLHPRTRKMMAMMPDRELISRFENHRDIIITEPASFLDMISLESNAKLIVTDSGGVQKEAYFFGKPCIILRPQTEWIELVENGNAILADADRKAIVDACERLLGKSDFTWPQLYGDGDAAGFICETINRCLA